MQLKCRSFDSLAVISYNAELQSHAPQYFINIVQIGLQISSIEKCTQFKL